MLSFGAVVCTYNRPTLLEQSLRYWSQSGRVPDQFIVVDATKTAATYRDRLIEQFPQLFSQSHSQYIVTDRPGLTRQRNLGLDAVKTDIVCFADDDAFVSASYIEKILEVFERDSQKVVGGVNGTAEGQFDTWSQRGYRKFRNYIRHHFGFLAQRIHIPKQKTQLFDPLPNQLKSLPLIHIDRLWGANMNYRTDAIKDLRFDENFQRYGLFEDVDFSVQLGMSYKLVCRLDANLSHDSRLGQSTRPNSARYFLFSWLNSAYIIEKLFPCSESRNSHRNLLYLTRLISRVAPLSFTEQHLKTLGSEILVESANHMIQSLRQCSNPGQLSDTFLQLQAEIADLDKTVPAFVMNQLK